MSELTAVDAVGYVTELLLNLIDDVESSASYFSDLQGTHTGGLMNPIIAFGPALLAKDFNNHWVSYSNLISCIIDVIINQSIKIYIVPLSRSLLRSAPDPCRPSGEEQS